MLYIKHPSDSFDRENIKELWRLCFGDEDDYIEFFLKSRVKSHNILALCDDALKENNILSVLFLLDGETRIENKKYKSAYIYAACTHPDYRGRGCMGALLKGCEDYCRKSGYDFISLVPATQSLFDFYRKFGYVEAFKERVYTFKIDKAKALSADEAEICDLKACDMLKIREEMLKNKDAFLWDEKALSYALEENKACEYESTAVKIGEEIAAYAFYYIENDILTVRECAFKDGAFPYLLKAVTDKIEFKKLVIKTPVDFNLCVMSKVRFNAMLLPLNEGAQIKIKNIKNACLGHTLG